MAKIATGQLTIYDQNDPIVAGAAPASPAVDALWMDNSVTPNMLKRWSGSAWVSVGALDANYSTVISTINQSISTLNINLAAVQGQVDKSITTWFGDVEPTMGNLPASGWVTTPDKEVHLGDIYYNNLTGFAYRFLVNATIYSWAKIIDSDIVLALQNAADAQDTADGKRRVFVAQPVPPYDVGDLWSEGAAGDLKRCIVARAELASYIASDWEKASKYTDDTTANSAAASATTANNNISDIVSDAKLTGNEKSSVRKEWNALVSEAVLNSTQATSFAVSATAYQDAIAALGTYLNNGTALTYATIVAGTIPTWIADANIGTTTTIVAATYRTTWKTYYDAQVNLLNALAAKAKSVGDTANTSITDIISDSKLTGNEKPAVRKEWDMLVGAAILNSTQATTFSVSVTAYQNAIAALGLYLNGGVAFTYANATAGTIPSWISDANMAITTTPIVGPTYRSTWKTFYDAHVALLNAIALKAKTLADTAQTTADSLEFGGRNLVQQAAISAYNTTVTSYVAATNIWNLSIPNATARGGLQLTGTTVRIPYGRTYVLSFEVFSPYATTWGMDNNDYPVSGGAWAGNDNDAAASRANSSTTITAGQWVKCWYRFANTNALNTLKVDIYDGTNFGIANNSGSTQNIQIRNVKGELGTKPTEWTPAPEDVQSQITTSNNNLNSLRQSMDNVKNIRLGMKIDYSAFATAATGYLYFCGLQLNATTFVEELADVDGSLYGSFYNSTNGNVEARVTVPVSKQAMNLNGVTVGTSGYLAWDNAAKALWFIHLVKVVGAEGVTTNEYWNKRSVGKVGDDTEIVIDSAIYILGELEI